jgi:hypothetical protein
MHRGYVTIHRKILDNPVVFKDSDHLSVWVYLMLNATHKNYQAMFNGRSIMLLPGQLITGRLSIAKKLKINDSKVKRILFLFKSEQLIDQQPTNQNSLITLVSWSKYQKNDQQNGQRVDNGWTTGDQQVTTNKNVNNVQPQENINKKETAANASKYSDAFESFWAEYPAKVGKATAVKSFKKAIKSVSIQTLIEAVKDYCKSDKVKKGVICNPSTWLNQERWNDEQVYNGKEDPEDIYNFGDHPDELAIIEEIERGAQEAKNNGNT